MSLLGLYRPGRTWLHRLPAGAKLLGLLVASVVVVALPGPAAGVGALAVALALVLWSGTGMRRLLRTMRGLLVVVVLMAAYTTWQQGWERLYFYR